MTSIEALMWGTVIGQFTAVSVTTLHSVFVTLNREGLIKGKLKVKAVIIALLTGFIASGLMLNAILYALGIYSGLLPNHWLIIVVVCLSTSLVFTFAQLAVEIVR